MNDSLDNVAAAIFIGLFLLSCSMCSIAQNMDEVKITIIQEKQEEPKPPSNSE